MRTKLDEIVEEEVRVGTLGVTALDATLAAKRVAERAFRYGVEQCVAATMIISGHEFDLNGKGWIDAILMGVEAAQKQMQNVQPAPAEEKGVRSAAEARTENWGINDWIKEARDLAGQMIYDEDTKKCLLVLAAALEEKCGPHPTYLHCDVCGSVDRRSGKDRRKS